MWRGRELWVAQVNKLTGAMTSSQLHLVDLAGCEQLKQSKAVGAHKIEAIGINTSLLVLGRCISALVKQQKHVPYLDSKLTLLLRGERCYSSELILCCRGVWRKQPHYSACVLQPRR